MTISKAAMDLLEARERLQSLKDERSTLSRRVKSLEAESSAAVKRLRELSGTGWNHDYGQITRAESDVKNAEERLRRESLPLAVWIENSSRWSDSNNGNLIVTRVTPKRIYVGPANSIKSEYYDRDTGMHCNSKYYGILDVPATLASIEQHATANQPSLKGK